VYALGHHRPRYAVFVVADAQMALAVDDFNVTLHACAKAARPAQSTPILGRAKPLKWLC
jgi:hypothetical protein